MTERGTSVVSVMKNLCLFLVFLLAVPLFASDETPVSTSNSNNLRSSTSTENDATRLGKDVSASFVRHEAVEAKVLKAYVVSEDGAEFRAYVVMWKGHEVIVSDMFAGSNYKVGDTIKFLAMKQRLPGGAGTNEVLYFPIMLAPHANRTITFADLHKKTPSYIDCHPYGVILYPGEIQINWDGLQQPDNPLSKLLDKVQGHKESENVVVLVRPQSVKFFRSIRNLVERRPIDVRYEAVDADTKLDVDDPGKSVVAVTQVREPTAGAVPTNRRAVITTQRPVFFERNYPLDIR